MIILNSLAVSQRLHAVSRLEALRSTSTFRQSVRQLRQAASASAASQWEVLRRPWLLPKPDSQVSTARSGLFCETSMQNRLVAAGPHGEP